MGGNVLKKLRSSKGASLTFALLAFLVCAVISAVLLAAGMASAGRLSGLAQSDQRYYAVTSAAQLFCDALDGQSFKIEQTDTLRETTRFNYIIDDEGGYNFQGSSPTTNPGGAAPHTYSMQFQAPYAPYKDGLTTVSTESLKGTSFLADAALYYVFGDTSKNADSVNINTFVGKTFDTTGSNQHSYSYPYTWTMTLEVNGKDPLKVNVTGSMNERGKIELTFQNVSSDSNVFSLVVTLQASVSEQRETTPERTVSSSNSMGATDRQYYVDVTTERDTIKTTAITWTVAEIKKVGA